MSTVNTYKKIILAIPLLALLLTSCLPRNGMTNLLKILTFLIVSLLFPSKLVYADYTPAPSLVQIQSAYSYTNVIDNIPGGISDLLVIGNYNITYIADPLTLVSIDKVFIAQLIAADGTTLIASTAPVPFAFHGYNQGTFGFYLNSAQVIANGITFGSPLSVKLTGNPSAWTNPSSVNTTLLTTWRSNTAQQGFWISQDILAQAASLASNWSTALLSNGSVLNATGTTYFSLVIPNVQQAAIQIFPSAINDGNFTPRGFNNKSNEASVANLLTAVGIKPAIQGISGLLCGFNVNGTPKCGDIGANLILIAITIAVAGYFITQTGRQWIGYLVGTIMFIMISLTGLVGFIFATISGVIAITVIWYMVWGKRT